MLRHGRTSFSAFVKAFGRILEFGSRLGGDESRVPPKNHNAPRRSDGGSVRFVLQDFSRIKTFCRDRSGSVALEFALVALPFFTLVIGLLEV